MLKGRVAATAALIALAMALVACGGGGGKPKGEAGNIKRGGTLVVALSNNPRNLDPMIQNDLPGGEIVNNIVEGLYAYDEQYKPQPWLAENVDISQDGLTYTFKLRQGIKFHDGTDMDAEAVKFSVDRVRNNSKSPGYKDGQEISETTAVD